MGSYESLDVEFKMARRGPLNCRHLILGRLDSNGWIVDTAVGYLGICTGDDLANDREIVDVDIN